MRILVVITFVFFALLQKTTAQDSLSTLKLAKQVKSRLRFLGDYNYMKYETLDVDTYAQKTATLLVQFLSNEKATDSTAKLLPNFSLAAQSTDSHRLRVYDFGYNCGGSRGMITHPIVQWQDRKGKLHAYNLSKRLFCGFTHLYPLKSSAGSFYLLLGSESGNTQTNQNIAYVIRIADDKLIATHHAFVNRAYINLPNTALSFNPKTQVLRCENELDSAEFTELLYSIPPFNNSAANETLFKLFAREFNEPVCLKFSGTRFARYAKCEAL